MPVSLTKSTGITGGALACAAVYTADLTGVNFGSILSVGIRDNSGGVGWTVGQFSGFDLDAVKLLT